MPISNDIPNNINCHTLDASIYVNVEGIELEVYEGEDYVKMETEDEYIDTDQSQERQSINQNHHTVASIICNNNRYGNDNVYVDFEQLPNQNRGRVQYSRNGIYDNENDNGGILHDPILNTIVKKEEKDLRNRYCNKYSLIMLSIIGMALIALITYAALINPMDVSTGKVFSLLTLIAFILSFFLHYYHILMSMSTEGYFVCRVSYSQ